MNRRQALAMLGTAAAGASAVAWLGRSGAAPAGTGEVGNVRGLPSEITPNDRFYTVSKNVLSNPTVRPETWRLDVYGLVGRRAALSLDDLRTMPAVDQYATLACISNEVPGRAISNARWKGVRLADVLEAAGGVRRGAVDAVFVCADNYTDSITVEKALDPQTLLVYEMNGEPLPKGHGFPLRAIVPGIYGMKNAKWIEGIEVVERDYLGYWMQRGWSDVAAYQTMSRIDVPREGATLEGLSPHGVGGIAFAGDRGIRAVEISADEGRTWTAAQVKPPLGPFSWSLWGVEWTPASAASYRLTVRATDGTGAAQTDERREPLPDGATGWHTITVTVA
jgi:DMSO/TMAO reductase YedYZ molybdopterin-dependent catalytic subunit